MTGAHVTVATFFNELSEGDPAPAVPAWQMGSFYWNAGGAARSPYYWPLKDHVVMEFPYWAPLSVLALVLAWQSRSLLRRRRASARLRKGLCISCGYDLRASSLRCPECGTPFTHRRRAPRRLRNLDHAIRRRAATILACAPVIVLAAHYTWHHLI